MRIILTVVALAELANAAIAATNHLYAQAGVWALAAATAVGWALAQTAADAWKRRALRAEESAESSLAALVTALNPDVDQ